MIRVCIFLYVTLVAHFFTQAQTFNLIAAVKQTAKIFTTDNLGNFYAVNQTNQLYKYNRNGKLLTTLNYNYNGNITQIDVTNPLEIYLFYKELNKVVFLDNNLAYRGEVSLSKGDVIQASAIARSYDNNIWVFDIADLQLKKINRQGTIDQMSGNIKQYMSQPTAASFLYDNNDRVFLVDSVNGVLVFDVFAAYVKTIPIKSVTECKVQEKYLFYTAQNQIYRYNWQTPQQSSFALPDSNGVVKISIEKERLYIQKADSIYIYGF